ncbi:hypothetical protein ACFSW8_06050 [Rubritalea tangerina]|uniref:EF-hand domain-containing protein n=2 Tax=Rubritalea tangerina TaxID=430798 RepID=A0ABW4Z973_9BACT
MASVSGGANIVENAEDAYRLARFDRDKNGVFCAEEFAEMQRVEEEMYRAHRALLLEKYDLNRDGELSKGELRQGRSRFREGVIEKYDVDKNGWLSAKELAVVKVDFIHAGAFPDFSLEARKC